MQAQQQAAQQNHPTKNKPQLAPSWLEALEPEFEKPYMKALKAFLVARKAERARIYPRGAHYFHALNLTPLDDVKVVILGQDPYHNPGQAHGLSFSVPQGVPVPPSLRNIYQEICACTGGQMPRHGNLEAWATQGVLLLNAVLTVEENQPGAHRGKGWEVFTDKIIKVINDQRDDVVFMLWGAYARGKKNLIDGQKHLILEAPHPSPLSAHRGFMGCGHFKKRMIFLPKRGNCPYNGCLQVRNKIKQ